MKTDPIRELVQARVAELGLSAYRLSQLCGNAIHKDTIAEYLYRGGNLTSRHLAAVLAALGWDGRLGWEEPPVR